ncbi:CAP domain-containing protein [Embleya sp. NPDC056575]|uniref:CAP domain-containing protein n=1 Tax=unclassified Embleya TaxID=2699296 RepID=UPI0036B88525
MQHPKHSQHPMHPKHSTHRKRPVHRHRRAVTTTVAAALAALVVAGCGSAGHHDGASRSAAPSATVAAADTTASATPSAATPPPTGDPTPSGGTGPSSTAPSTRKPAPSTTTSRPGTDAKSGAAAGTRPTTASAADGPPGANPTVRGNRPPSQSITDAEAMSLELLNAERAKVGLPPLRASADLSAFARTWAEHMRRNGFAHSGREADALVTGRRTGVAENIVMWGDAALTARQAAEKFQDMWRHSPGHYRNQTDPSHTEAGVGVFHDESGWWGVHEFANG